MTPKPRVLAVGAHPDDVEFGMAGTLILLRDAGYEPSTYRTGGGSDANVLAGKGVPVLAMAAAMSGVHSTHEHLVVADLQALTAICVAVARRLAVGA